ncbi:hypothetical protein CAT49_15670 [Acinetobacter baumannii]|jgi:hypothetical protein|nr:hypothetical protein CAT49_15670 [Acinetobacter baumannii]
MIYYFSKFDFKTRSDQYKIIHQVPKQDIVILKKLYTKNLDKLNMKIVIIDNICKKFQQSHSQALVLIITYSPIKNIEYFNLKLHNNQKHIPNYL